jgi:hypothetical protein
MHDLGLSENTAESDMSNTDFDDLGIGRLMGILMTSVID